MEAPVCRNCNTPVFEKAIFCYACGLQVKCKNCQEELVEGANHCIACGTPVTINAELAANQPLNTITFKENKDERFYEIMFTNDVGKEIKEVLADLLKNKLGQEPGHHLSIRESTPPPAIMMEQQPVETDTATESLMTSGLQPAGLQLEENKPMEIPEPEYPHLNDLEIKLTCKENKWLLLYAFYLSEYGTSTFNKNTIWQLYKDKRITETRFKNLGTNWKSLFKKYICTVKENEFRFTPQGLTKVKSLIQIADQGKKASYAPRKGITFIDTNAGMARHLPVSRKVIANSIVPDEFDVYKNSLKISLEEFFNRKQPGNGNPNRIVTIAYYITKINHQEYFTEGNIDFAYRILNLTGKPVHLKQVIINLKNDRIWFQKVIDRNTNGWKLTRQAEIYVEEKLPPVS